MAKIIGIRPSEFKGESGDTITGKNIYVTYPLENGEGLGADRIFITDKKLQGWTYKPKVGDEVRVDYNRYGRCAGMEKAQ